MVKLSLITPMWSDTVKDLIDSILAVKGGEDITLYQNTPGGSPFSGWALAGVMQEHEGKITIKAFGDSSSMGFYNLLYADRVEALNVTKFTIHRADGYVETEDDKKLLASINKDLRAAMESKIDAEKFLKITGHTIDEIFDPNQRLDVTVTAKELKSLGVVDKIIQLSTTEISALNKKFAAITDIFEDSERGSSEETQGREKKKDVKAENDNNNNNQKVNKMTVQEIQSQHPEAYSAILALGAKDEKDRVGSLMAYMAVDPEAVKKAVDSGDKINETFRSEMAMKQVSAMKLEDIKAESNEDVEGKETPNEKKEETKEEKEVKAFNKDVFAELGIKEEE